jgi:hypothetical protein
MMQMRDHGHRLDLVVRDIDHRGAEPLMQRRISPRRHAQRRIEIDGGSSSGTLWMRTMARPSATRWRCPPDSACGLRSSRVAARAWWRRADAALDLVARHGAPPQADRRVSLHAHVRVGA